MPHGRNRGPVCGTADISGAFLQAEMEDDVWIKFEGEMVDVLVSINKGLYGPCVCHYNRKTYLYAKANKAIYGCLKSALLFYQLFSGELKKWGFKQNPYDACTFNKLVNGSQLTIVFHVDDCKISHMSKAVVNQLWKQLSTGSGRKRRSR